MIHLCKTIVILVALVQICAMPAYSLEDCVTPGTECAGLFDATKSNIPISKPQRSLDPIPTFPATLPGSAGDGLLTICTNVNIVPEDPKAKGGVVYADALGCGEKFQYFIDYYLRVGDPVKDPNGQVETLKIFATAELNVGGQLAGGLITASAKVTGGFEYTVVVTTFQWSATYTPIKLDISEKDLGGCATPRRVKTTSSCYRER